jgi:hypothetical protein
MSSIFTFLRLLSTMRPTLRLLRSTVWERQAKQIQNKHVQNPYLDLMREAHDPRLHLKTLEDELQGAIGSALGKQGQKLLGLLNELGEAYSKYEEACTSKPNSMEQTANNYNTIRKLAIQARWELMVHRQAAGFLVQNHQYVTKAYPIPEAIVIKETDKSDASLQEMSAKSAEPVKKWTDQLDWWERIGRWK